jgi:hydroxymethylglutaryl-CoA synthase
MIMKIGIEAMAFHAPNHYIDLTELAQARDVDPDKYLIGLGQTRMAIATPCEDTVSLAVNAGMKALTKFGIPPQDIGMLVVGTETAVDHSKPVAVYVHQALNLRSNCRTFETKHACFGAMAGVTSAHDWIASGRANGSKALIIASDIARYGIGDPGEPTQGAGAVAMVISNAPKLVSFDTTIYGDYTRQVMDFWRPLYSPVAFVDGHYSVQCYLDALEGALKDASGKVPSNRSIDTKNFQACLYHVPFVKMAYKAHHRHVEVELGRSIDPKGSEAGSIKEAFAKRVKPWLDLNAEVGNIYTGSLFLSLIDFLRKKNSANGLPISLFSYGSGCAASFGIAYPVPGCDQYKSLLDPGPELKHRTKLSIADYEALSSTMNEISSGNESSCDLTHWGHSASDFHYLGTRDHIRQYNGL